MTAKKTLPTPEFIAAAQAITELVKQVKNPSRVGFSLAVSNAQQYRYILMVDGTYQTASLIAKSKVATAVSRILITFIDDSYRILKSPLDLPSGDFEDIRIDDDCVSLRFTQGSINVAACGKKFPRKPIKSVELT